MSTHVFLRKYTYFSIGEAMQETLQKAYESRMGLIAQQQELGLLRAVLKTLNRETCRSAWSTSPANWKGGKGGLPQRPGRVLVHSERRSNKIIAEKETELGDKQKHLIKSEPQSLCHFVYCNSLHVCWWLFR
eukprot:Skav224937  [mRNA]  locus=scaffold2105:160185:162783:- [translate_table: standard]